MSSSRRTPVQSNQSEVQLSPIQRTLILVARKCLLNGVFIHTLYIFLSQQLQGSAGLLVLKESQNFVWKNNLLRGYTLITLAKSDCYKV